LDDIDLELEEELAGMDQAGTELSELEEAELLSELNNA
jgi:hypothetical protein